MPPERRRSLPVRLAWLAAFWLAGVASLGFIAWLLKLLMRAAGLSA